MKTTIGNISVGHNVTDDGSVGLLGTNGNDAHMIAVMTNRDTTEGDARRLVNAWNCHDDLVDALNEIIAYEDRGRAKGEPRIAEGLYNLAKNAIKKTLT